MLPRMDAAGNSQKPVLCPSRKRRLPGHRPGRPWELKRSPKELHRQSDRYADQSRGQNVSPGDRRTGWHCLRYRVRGCAGIFQPTVFLVSGDGEVIGISGFSFTEADFGLVASAADIRPRLEGLVAGRDISILRNRKIRFSDQSSSIIVKSEKTSSIKMP